MQISPADFLVASQQGSRTGAAKTPFQLPDLKQAAPAPEPPAAAPAQPEKPAGTKPLGSLVDIRV